jgi:methyl-accepting chemotaxis protein
LRSGQGDVTRLDKEMKELTDHIFEQVETVKTKKKTEMEKTKASSQALIMMSSGGATVLGMGIAFIISAGISGPVNRMTDVMGVLADDNTDIDIPYQDRGDELGDMAQAVNIFKKSAIKRKEIEAEQERLDAKRAEEKRRMMNELADEFENTVGGIVTAVSSSAEELEATATDLSATADQTKQQATSVAGGAEESASNVQTVASAAEELSASIAEVSTQVMKSAEKSKQAEQRAADATEQVSGLNNAANQIGQVIELIQDIAEQTNLLALNATIEAARAGDAGKGFAVVASEVKSLANDTAKATARITEYIDQIQSETKTAVHAIDGISSTIDEINDMAQSVSAAAEQQDAATKEIARNVQEASQGTREVTKNITGLTQAAQDTGAASDQMLSSAKTLATNSSKLEAEVNDFLVKIREG